MQPEESPQRNEGGQPDPPTRQMDTRELAARLTTTPQKEKPSLETATRPYEEWDQDDLYDLARQLDIEGRASMSTQELIRAIRAH